MLVYISTAIDRCDPDKAKENQQRLEKLFLLAAKHPISFFLPYSAFRCGEMDVATALMIRAANRGAMDASDAMVLAYTPGVESWGVPDELQTALEMHHGMPVAIFGTRDDMPLPVYLTRKLNQVPVFFSPSAVLDWLLKDVMKENPPGPMGCTCGFLGDAGEQAGDWHCSPCPKSMPF